jgi:hypothetical protein
MSVVSKLQERLITGHLLSYLTSMGVIPSLQSAYRAYHSTDILQALDVGHLAALMLLNLSTAFDTVDHIHHTAMFRRLETVIFLDPPNQNGLSPTEIFAIPHQGAFHGVHKYGSLLTRHFDSFSLSAKLSRYHQTN